MNEILLYSNMKYFVLRIIILIGVKSKWYKIEVSQNDMLTAWQAGRLSNSNIIDYNFLGIVSNFRTIFISSLTS